MQIGGGMERKIKKAAVLGAGVMGATMSGLVAARNGRKALAIALTGMVRDGEITRARASVLARMVLRENAKKLYGL